jgi:hypothetical protein
VPRLADDNERLAVLERTRATGRIEAISLEFARIRAELAELSMPSRKPTRQDQERAVQLTARGSFLRTELRELRRRAVQQPPETSNEIQPGA